MRSCTDVVRRQEVRCRDLDLLLPKNVKAQPPTVLAQLETTHFQTLRRKRSKDVTIKHDWRFDEKEQSKTFAICEASYTTQK